MSRKKTDKKMPSFSDAINANIYIYFGIAFFVIFIGGVILQINYSVLDRTFLIRIAVTFAIFFVIYLAAAKLAVYRIRKMFYPLDKFANSLLDDDILVLGENDDIHNFTENLKAEMQKMQQANEDLMLEQCDIKQQKNEYQQDLNDIDHSIEKAFQHLYNLSQASRKISRSLSGINEKKEELEPLFSELSQLKETIYEETEELRGKISKVTRNSADVKEDFTRTKDAFSVLNNMLGENNDLVDNLYSEVSALQSLTSQINLYSVNMTMELARSGIRNNSLSAGMEDMKNMSSKINEKTDDIMMLLIRNRNSNKLAIDQSDFCSENLMDGENGFDDNANLLENINEQMLSTLEILDHISNDLSLFHRKTFDIGVHLAKETKDFNLLLEEQKKLEKHLQQVQVSSKS